VDARLQDHPFLGSETAMRLREQIREFNSAALPAVAEEDE
jgi:hypothetical protein